MWIKYSGPQTGTGKHCSAGRVQLAQQQGLQATRRSVLAVDRDKARYRARRPRDRASAREEETVLVAFLYAL